MKSAFDDDLPGYPDASAYVIRSLTEEDENEEGTFLYWSNVLGWSDFYSATTFRPSEAMSYSRPELSEWVPL